MPWLVSRAAAVVYAWYPGAEGGHAVADVLFGDVNPAGRLPITIYRSAADLPPFADYAMRGRTYRYFDGEPLYGFGYGLSYTTFRYAEIGAVAGAYAAAAVAVENVGSRPGDEVVQVYVIPRGAPGYAPHRWLAGFQRVSLKPGERRIVKIPFGASTLTYVDEAGARRPLDGQVDIAVGGRQPDRSGHYASDTEGATTTIALGLKTSRRFIRAPRRRPARARRSRPHRRQQPVEVERLAQRRRQAELVDALRIQVVRRDDDNRDVGDERRLPLQGPQLEAVQVGQHDVEQDEIRLRRRVKPPKRLASVGAAVDAEALCREELRQRRAQHEVVLDQQHQAGGRFSRALLGPHIRLGTFLEAHDFGNVVPTGSKRKGKATKTFEIDGGPGARGGFLEGRGCLTLLTS